MDLTEHLATELSWPQRTDRLTLRPLTEADSEPVYAYRSQPAAYEWITNAPGSLDDLRARLGRTAADPRTLVLAIDLDGLLIGDCFLRIEDGWAQDGLAAATGCQAEIGYIIDPAYAGRGLATEVTRELVRIGFADLGLRRLTAGCFAANRASRRVLEKAGMRLEALTRKECLHRDRGWLDGCLYAVLAEEWAG